MTQIDTWQATYDHIQTIIKRCEKSQRSFKEGSSQFSLLRNRIKALVIANVLLMNRIHPENTKVLPYNKKELEDALKPIISIINKCRHGQMKFDQASTHYRRFQSLIDSMNIALNLLQEAINQESDLR